MADATTPQSKPRKTAKKAAKPTKAVVAEPAPAVESPIPAEPKQAKSSRAAKASKASKTTAKPSKSAPKGKKTVQPVVEMVTMTERNPVIETVSEAEAEPAPIVPESEGELAPVAAPEEEDWAAKVAQSRRKPVQVEDHAESLSEARSQAPVSDEPPTRHIHRIDEPAVATTAPRSDTDLTVPEQFLLLALTDNWDDRVERIRPGGMGAAVVGSLLLDLAVRGKLKVQRDRFTIVDGPVGDADLAVVADRVRQLKDLPSKEAMRRLGWRLTDRIRPWKARLQAKGLARERTWKHFGIWPRSETVLIDRDAQERVTKRLLRMLAGSGTPDADSVALMGLVQAAGLLPNLVPSSTMSFNNKRISALIAGRDTLHYRVDGQMAQVQQVALTTILQNVRELA